MKLLKPSDVMAKLNVSRSKVYQLIRDGVIPSVRIGGCLRVAEELLDAMIHQQLSNHPSYKYALKEGIFDSCSCKTSVEGELLTPQEVMAKLSMSQGKVYQMIRDGKIPSVFDQGRIMIPEEELNEMLYQQLTQFEGNPPASREKVLVLFGGGAERRKD